MQRWIVVAAMVTAIACSSSKKSEPNGPPTKKTYSLVDAGSSTPVKIEVAIPASWTADSSGGDGPAFKIDGVDVKLLTFVAQTLNGDAPARMAKSIKMQYGDAAGVTREDLADGRVWMVETEERNVHARLFVPFKDGVAMGVAVLGKDSASRLPEIRTVFETLTVVP